MAAIGPGSGRFEQIDGNPQQVAETRQGAFFKLG